MLIEITPQFSGRNIYYNFIFEEGEYSNAFKEKNKAYVLTVVILIAIFIFYFFDNIGKTYGNDKESIEKVIQSIEGYENESIDILEIKDIYDERLVAFLSNMS
ncbi:hypothetical protein GCM10011351_28940 [Paraliobacillus quinghaiensis]|uniref:Uncharacterized protein n=1 Tax=Paraliobacillus quinghaiensis TaxID=470815 RepID=A0A917TWG5_9BACI|nr:hypothetical protein [Paraliobacillus quinghaiensis]GGM40931.1 hypothetical protein GCM10011351_28940 [Paraliobacillus quinghaiensis]